MAKYRKRKTNNKNRAKQLTSLAYDMGLVGRGLKNPDSRISSAYNRGMTKPSKRQKKTLFGD